jgi:hypothetical protein
MSKLAKQKYSDAAVPCCLTVEIQARPSLGWLGRAVWKKWSGYYRC